MEFVFKISEYEQSITAQAAKGIRLCAEERSRQVLPGVWELTDKINEANQKKKQKPGPRHIIYGVLLVGMGLYLLIPGLVTGQVHPDWIIVGALGLAVGVLTLTGKLAGNEKNARFAKDAKKLMRHLSGAVGTTVRLTQTGMEAPGFSAPYEQFRWIMETRDAFLFVREEQMSVLQKKDLEQGTPEELRAFLEQRKLPGTGLIRINT